MKKHEKSGKLVIFSAPSGAGKTTVVKALLNMGMHLVFSISATTRLPRKDEKNGREYHFMSKEIFFNHVKNNDFIEYEEVYEGIYYGTLKQQVDEMLQKGIHVVFDIDVVGGINIKSVYGEQALAIFIMPPDLDELERRLIKRGTETPEEITKRLGKATWELKLANKFDKIVVNDKMGETIRKVESVIKMFIQEV